MVFIQHVGKGKKGQMHVMRCPECNHVLKWFLPITQFMLRCPNCKLTTPGETLGLMVTEEGKIRYDSNYDNHRQEKWKNNL